MELIYNTISKVSELRYTVNYQNAFLCTYDFLIRYIRLNFYFNGGSFFNYLF